MIKCKHKFCPISKQLSDRVDKNWLNMKRGTKKEGGQVLAQSYREESAKKGAKVDSLIADWTRGGHKHMDLEKADRIFRLLWENFNSLHILTDSTVL